MKGDVVTDQYTIECKTTKNDSYSLKVLTLKKVQDEAWSVGKTPALVICFEGNPVGLFGNNEWAVIPLKQFKVLIGDA